MKASDLDDVQMLRTVERLGREHNMWAMGSWVADEYPGVPPKVVQAKLSRLLKRGFLTGCDCGCRGDWELTSRGRVFAGIEGEWGRNPMGPLYIKKKPYG